MTLEAWLCATYQLHATEDDARACAGHDEDNDDEREETDR